MSLKIDEYLNSLGAFTPTAAREISSDTIRPENKERDSYIPSETDTAAAIPSDNYNDILKIMMNSKAEASGSSTSSETESKPVLRKESDGSEDSDNKNEVTKKIVTINGITYLQTEAVINGIKIVTRTKLSGEKIPDIDQIGGPNDDISVNMNK